MPHTSFGTEAFSQGNLARYLNPSSMKLTLNGIMRTIRLDEPQTPTVTFNARMHSSAPLLRKNPPPHRGQQGPPPTNMCNFVQFCRKRIPRSQGSFCSERKLRAVLSSFSSIQCDVMAAQPYLSYEIRPVEASDAFDVFAVEKASFNDPYSSEVLIDLMNRHQDHFFVASFHSKVVGYAVASANGMQGHIVSVAVDPIHRRRRIGTALLSALNEKLAEEGIEQIHLEVRKGNTGAIAFYQRMGYRPSSKIRHYYADGEDALVLARSAESSPAARH
jgi:ribosomal-protein-alanine N-acetyltransferase